MITVGGLRGGGRRASGGTRATSLVAVGLVLGAVTSCGSAVVDSAESDADGTMAAYYVSAYGVRVGMPVSYDEARVVTDARLVGAGESAHATIWPTDGTDPDMEPESISLTPGEKVSLEGSLLLACPVDADEMPVFEVVSERDGSERTDRFTAGDADGYERALAEWCERPVTLSATGTRMTPRGRYELRVELSNPGPDAVTVTSAAVTHGASSWEEASVVVPPGTITGLTIHGRGPVDCKATPPWALDKVTVDGEVIRPSGDNVTAEMEC